MIAQSTAILDRFFSTFHSASRPLLLLDYDGTLAPFRVNRFQAVPSPGVRELLNRIQSQTRTRIVVVTGRPAEEIGPLLALDQPIEVWGLHGFERLHADGRRERDSVPAATQQKLDELHQALRRDSFGGLFEPKPNGAAMHWRGIPDQQAATIEKRTRALLEPLAIAGGFRLLPFEYGIELRTGRDKGGAVKALLAESARDIPVAYLGDDLTDEAAFCALNGRGLSVLVRTEPRESAADLYLKPPEELLEFLTCWLNSATRNPEGESKGLSTRGPSS